MARVFTGCVNTRTDFIKSLAVWNLWMNQTQTIPGQITGHIFHVFSGMAEWKWYKYKAQENVFGNTLIINNICNTSNK